LKVRRVLGFPIRFAPVLASFADSISTTFKTDFYTVDQYKDGAKVVLTVPMFRLSRVLAIFILLN
jgi:hypothetical protein